MEKNGGTGTVRLGERGRFGEVWGKSDRDEPGWVKEWGVSSLR